MRPARPLSPHCNLLGALALPISSLLYSTGFCITKKTMSEPAFPPPVNPDDLGHGPLIVGITWAATGIAIIAVALRFYVRKALVRVIDWDDWIMLVALVSFLWLPASAGQTRPD